MEGKVTLDPVNRKVRGRVLVLIRILDRESRRAACTGVARFAGYEMWLRNGCRHRGDDLPAVTITSGTDIAELWYFEGQLHRDGGLPAVIDLTGNQKWHFKGKVLPEDAPRYDRDGRQVFYKTGRQPRNRLVSLFKD